MTDEQVEQLLLTVERKGQRTALEVDLAEAVRTLRQQRDVWKQLRDAARAALADSSTERELELSRRLEQIRAILSGRRSDDPLLRELYVALGEPVRAGASA